MFYKWVEVHSQDSKKEKNDRQKSTYVRKRRQGYNQSLEHDLQAPCSFYQPQNTEYSECSQHRSSSSKTRYRPWLVKRDADNSQEGDKKIELVPTLEEVGFSLHENL